MTLTRILVILVIAAASITTVGVSVGVWQVFGPSNNVTSTQTTSMVTSTTKTTTKPTTKTTTVSTKFTSTVTSSVKPTTISTMSSTGTTISNSSTNAVSTATPCTKQLRILVISDDSVDLFVNGQLVLQGNEYATTFNYTVNCASGNYLIATKTTGSGAPNGFGAAVFLNNVEIAYTGDGQWLGFNAALDTTSVDWFSDFNYDDSNWISMNPARVKICSDMYYLGLPDSQASYVALPNCSTSSIINFFRLKLTDSTQSTSTVTSTTTNDTTSTSISTTTTVTTSTPTDCTKQLRILIKSDDTVDLFVNGQLVLMGSDYATTFNYTVNCASGNYLIATKTTGSGAPNGFGAAVFLNNVEIAYTGGGQFVGFNAAVDVTTVDWVSNFNYDDSKWTSINQATICSDMYYLGLPNSQASYVALPNCNTRAIINYFRLKLTDSTQSTNTLTSTATTTTVTTSNTNDCTKQLRILIKSDDTVDLFVNGQLVLMESDYATVFTYTVNCASGNYLIAARTTGGEQPNGFGAAVFLNNVEIAYTGGGQFVGFNAAVDVTTVDWVSNFNYDDSKWTSINQATICSDMYYLGLPDSQASYVALPNCNTRAIINYLRLKLTV